MNIFYLDEDPKICAQYHCDKTLCKNDIGNGTIIMHCSLDDRW